jgi:hypothetical protein
MAFLDEVGTHIQCAPAVPDDAFREAIEISPVVHRGSK